MVKRRTGQNCPTHLAGSPHNQYTFMPDLTWISAILSRHLDDDCTMPPSFQQYHRTKVSNPQEKKFATAPMPAEQNYTQTQKSRWTWRLPHPTAPTICFLAIQHLYRFLAILLGFTEFQFGEPITHQEFLYLLNAIHKHTRQDILVYVVEGISRIERDVCMR